MRLSVVHLFALYALCCGPKTLVASQWPRMRFLTTARIINQIDQKISHLNNYKLSLTRHHKLTEIEGNLEKISKPRDFKILRYY